jgi:hypothetical protein
MYVISEVSGHFMAHQMGGIRWMLSYLGNGGLLDVYIGDKIGLGKTKLSLSILSAIKLIISRCVGCTNTILEKSAAILFQIKPQRTIMQQRPCLIVVPAILEEQWFQALGDLVQDT